MDVVSFVSRYQKTLRNRVDDISLSHYEWWCFRLGGLQSKDR